jgi:hypothetical protein
MESYRKFSRKKSGSVMIVVLTLMAFCALILQLFLGDVFDIVFFLKRMGGPVALKVEAYSVLDGLLSLLGKYKQDSNVNSRDGRAVNKGGNKLIFDADILGGVPGDAPIPAGELISAYLAQQLVELARTSASLPVTFPKPAGTGDPSTFRQGDMTVRIRFEDLNARTPLSKRFGDFSSDLPRAVLNKVPHGCMSATGRANVRDFMSGGGIFSRWSTVQFVANDKKLDIKSLRKMFTLESCIDEFIGKLKPGFKINLFTAPKDILDAIGQRSGTKIPDTRRLSDRTYDPLIGPGGSLSKYCSNEIQFCEITVSVSTDSGDTHEVRCVCDATSNWTSGRRFLFNIVKIEES